MTSGEPLQRLLSIMQRLRDPESGCAWDRAQTFSSIAPYTLEEAYEVADAIDRSDLDGLREELGDLLLQVVFHAQMAAEAGVFTFAEVAQTVADKMEARHPHVFGDEQAGMTHPRWEDLKAAERTGNSFVIQKHAASRQRRAQLARWRCQGAACPAAGG